MKAVKSYQDLEVWQRAVTLVTRVYQFVRKFPSSERFGLVVQIQRAATSVPANIAEGWGGGRRKSSCSSFGLHGVPFTNWKRISSLRTS
jgi:hypothetical protein